MKPDLSPKEFSELVPCCVITVYRMIKSGRIEARKDWKGNYLIKESEIKKIKGK